MPRLLHLQLTSSRAHYVLLTGSNPGNWAFAVVFLVNLILWDTGSLGSLCDLSIVSIAGILCTSWSSNIVWFMNSVAMDTPRASFWVEGIRVRSAVAFKSAPL